MNQIEWCKDRLVQHEKEFSNYDYYLSHILPLKNQAGICEALLKTIG